MLKRWLFVVTFLFITVASCSPTWVPPKQNGTMTPAGTAYVCLDIPQEQMAGAKKAVDAWDRSLGQWKHIVPIEGRGNYCSYWVHEVPDQNIGDPSVMAWVNRIGGTEVSLRKDWYEFDVTDILMHEMGHLFGAQHVAGTLMNPTYWRNGFECPDKTTIAQVAAWNKIDIDLLSWCY